MLVIPLAQSYHMSWLAAYPIITDGLILQGISIDSSALPQTLAGFNIQSVSINQSYKFGAPFSVPIPSSTISLIWAYLGANQFAFFTSPYYNSAIAESYTEHSQEPFGELLTIDAQPRAEEFTEPALVTGNEDEIFCGENYLAGTGEGNTSVGISIPKMAKIAFPKSCKCGHAVNASGGGNLVREGGRSKGEGRGRGNNCLPLYSFSIHYSLHGIGSRNLSLTA